MPAIYHRQGLFTPNPAATDSVWRRAAGNKDWFQQNATALYIVITAVLTILGSIILFLVWRLVLRKKVRARGFCIPASRRPKVPVTSTVNHSDPYADIEEAEEIDEEEKWRRETIRIEWSNPAHRRSSFFVGVGKAQPAWDNEGQNRLLFEQEKEIGYGYDYGRRESGKKGGRISRSDRPFTPYQQQPMSPLSRLQASIPRMAHTSADRYDGSYGQSCRSTHAPSFTSSFGHTPDQSEVGASRSQSSASSNPYARTTQAIHFPAPRIPYNPFSDPSTTAVSPLDSLASIASLKPEIKAQPQYHPYPLFALSSAPVVVVTPKKDLSFAGTIGTAPKPLFLPCPINIPGSHTSTPPLSSTSSYSSRSPVITTPRTYPYPICTTPVNHRHIPPPSSPCITVTLPEKTSAPHETFSDAQSPSKPWRSFRDSFRPTPPRKDGGVGADEYDHYQLPIIRPGSAFVPFPPTFTNFLDREHRDRAKDRMSMASSRPDRSSRMYEQLWVDANDKGPSGRYQQQSSSRAISSIYPSPNMSSRGRGVPSSFAASRMSRRPVPSPLRQINEI